MACLEFLLLAQPPQTRCVRVPQPNKAETFRSSSQSLGLSNIGYGSMLDCASEPQLDQLLAHRTRRQDPVLGDEGRDEIRRREIHCVF